MGPIWLNVWLSFDDQIRKRLVVNLRHFDWIQSCCQDRRAMSLIRESLENWFLLDLDIGSANKPLAFHLMVVDVNDAIARLLEIFDVGTPYPVHYKEWRLKLVSIVPSPLFLVEI